MNISFILLTSILMSFFIIRLRLVAQVECRFLSRVKGSILRVEGRGSS